MHATFSHLIPHLVRIASHTPFHTYRASKAELPRLLQHLDAVPPARLAAMQRAVHAVRDYFVYKDVYSPYRYHRRDFVGAGTAGQDAFLLLTLALLSLIHI